MNDHSQHGETAWILENLKPPVGTFCEVGAFDGVMSSNTYLLEQLGWTGICVEADPFLAAQCQANRKALTYCVGASRWNGFEMFNVNTSDRGLSGFSRPGTKRIPVFTVTLARLLEASSIRELTLLSIDTEGTELDVWEGIGSTRPRIVIMEYRTCDEPPQGAAIVERMTKDGYREVHRTPCNLIFTR